MKKIFRRKSPLTRFAQGREIVHNAEPGQTFIVGATEYLVQKNGSFRRLDPK